MSDNIPFWKYALSYLTTVELERASSDYNQELHVNLRRGQLQLCTANAIYSYGKHYDNFGRTFRRLRWAQLPGQEVLLLGLGLGSIPYLLEVSLGRRLLYTAVEIDETIIELANRYVLNKLHSPLDVVYANAEVYVEVATDHSYDLICMDVFDDDRIPESMQQPDFLAELARILTPGGLILYNCLAYTPDDRRLSRQFFDEVFQPAFPHAHLLDLQSNYVLLSDGRFLD